MGVRLVALAVMAAGLMALQAGATEATFERTLSVSGRPELSVATGSGNIHLTHGGAGRIHIFGRVRSSWGGSDDKLREIATNPPIVQTGNVIRVGQGHQNLHNISIDYEIEAPAETYLDAASGSGDVTDDGVGSNGKLSTGSGNIHATGLQGGFSVETGSGTIYAEQAGHGDVKAETGSGNIELRNLRGAVRVETGSGNIKVGGAALGAWHLETGSGNVEYWSGGAGMDLDAETGSGGIHVEASMNSRETSEHHHVTGKVNGGGPTVRIETGAGDVRVH